MKRLFSVIIMIMGLSLDALSQGDGSMTAYSMLTMDGRRLVSYKGADGKDVFELVPVSELPEGLPEVRPWKIFSIKSSHTDIGLHNAQYMQRHGSVKRIRDAAALVDDDKRADTHPREIVNFISASGEGMGITMSSSVVATMP